ncbi:MAG TPA: SDR family oxidoreductase [Acidimicrobiales bacterium]|nr:SDR family oxidoreductase [Acidimicrobiales bacterium]
MSSPALVVGGASGIGAALVERYRAEGRQVVVWDRAAPGDVVCDIADPAQIDAALRRTVADHGLPREVSVTAGIGHAGSLAEAAPEEWDHVMAVNARGPWLCMRSVARALMASGLSGSFVATSSVSAHLADRVMGLYCASKAALGMVVKVAAAEWAHAGIRVNAVAPGVTATPMVGAPPDSAWLRGVAARTALGRLGSADDVAQAISSLHAMSWVTGQIVDCDGGLSLYSPISPPHPVPGDRPR